MLALVVVEPMEVASSALSLTFEGCSDVEAREIEDMVRADITWAPGDPSIGLTLRCRGTGVRLSLMVDDVPTEERFVDLAQTAPEARLRTVALIATELVLVGRTAAPSVPLKRTDPDHGPASPAPQTDERPSVSSRAPPTPAPRTHAVPARGSSILIATGASLHAAVPSVPLFELGGRFREDLSSWGGIALDLAGLYQRRETTSGTLMATGGDVALVAETRLRWAGGALRAGVGGHVLVLRLSGSTARAELRPTTAWGAAVGPLVRIAGSREWERAVAEVALEGGWCGPEVVGTVSGAPGIGVGSWWGGLSLAAGWRLGRDRDRAAISSAEEDPRFDRRP